MFEDIFSKLLNRSADRHKYDFGHVLIIGGSPGLVGAPLLAGKAALRVGAGLVTIASEAGVVDKLERRVEEIMTLRIKTTEQVIDFIKERKVNALVIGPGLGLEAEELVLGVLEKVNLPTVTDGGALNILASSGTLDILLQKLDKSSKNLILTPHLGEYQRFFDEKLPELADRLKIIVQKFAKDNGLTLVLKGHPTYVASPGGELYVNTTGGPGLATAGTGDVLTGIIGGMIAQGVEPFDAAKAGVYLHGLAGDIATKRKTEAGVIAGDVIETVPEALKQIA